MIGRRDSERMECSAFIRIMKFVARKERRKEMDCGLWIVEVEDEKKREMIGLGLS